MHFKVEICFELVIHPSKVFISLSSMSKLAHWEWKAWLSFGGWGGGGQQGRGDQLSWLNLQMQGSVDTKETCLGLGFLPC